MKFAKLFDLENDAQVLYTLNEDEENKEVPCFIAIRCDYNGLVATLKMGYASTAAMKRVFESINQKNAENTFKNIVAQFS